MSTLKTNNIQHVDRSDPSIIINTDGSVNIAGTMTYEDVTNVDAVGIITGRNNIDAQKQVLVGTGVSVKAGGINVTAGITTVQALQATTGTFSAAVSGTTGTFSGDVSIADKIIHTGDTDTAIRFSSADTISIETGGVTRATVTGNNIDFPDAGTLRFGNSNDLQIYHGTGGASNIIHSNTSQPLIISASGAGTIRFDTNSNERFRIDSNGRLIIGHTASTGEARSVQIVGTNADTSSMQLIRHSADANASKIDFTKSRNATKGSNTIVQDDDNLGDIAFRADDGTDLNTEGARISAAIDGTPGANDIPGRLVFLTTADGENTPTERLRINSSGNFLIGHTSSRDLGGLSSQKLVIEGTSGNAAIAIVNNQNSGGFASLRFSKSRGTSVGSNTIVQANDPLGGIVFCGADGNDMTSVGAQILAEVDGTPGSNDMPARLEFFTTPDGSASPTERMRINNLGNVSIGGIAPVATSTAYNGASLHLHNTTSGSNYGSQIHLTSDHTGSAASDGTQISVYSTDLYINNQENGSTHFYNNGSPTATIKANGNFGINTQSPTDKLHVNGTALISSNLYCNNNVYLAANKGIYFDGGTGASNYMDDYEEGTWTPTLTNTFATGVSSGRVCVYRKIGNFVFFTFDIFKSANNMDINTSGNTIIGGLPFTTPSAFNSQMTIGIYMYDNSQQYLTNYIDTTPQIVINGHPRINNVRHLWGFGCYPVT